jgi:hypothetical protein
MKKMKKIIYLLIAIPMVAFAQEKKEEKTETLKIKNHTLSLFLNVADPTGFGLNYEGTASTGVFKEHYNSRSIYINAAATSVDAGPFKKSITASGFEFGFGNRTYLSKLKNSGFYAENFWFTYGEVKFDDVLIKGKYSYISIVNPDLGYKVKIAKVINLELNAGFTWKWEMLKGQGDVDNKMFDNLVPKVGLKVGYIF